jgi:hypothetical protein
MTESNSDAPITDGTDTAPNLANTRLRGDALDGAEQKSSVRDPDAELRLDGEEDSLYSDGLDVGDKTESWAGTDGGAPKGIKG